MTKLTDGTSIDGTSEGLEEKTTMSLDCVMYPSFLNTMEYEPWSTSFMTYSPLESVLVAYGVPSRKTSTPSLVLESPPRTTEPWIVPFGERTMEPRLWALPLRGETPVLIAPKETSSVVAVKALELVMFTSLSLFDEK